MDRMEDDCGQCAEAETGSTPDLTRILSLVGDSFIVSRLAFILYSFLKCHFEKFLSAGTSHAH